MREPEERDEHRFDPEIDAAKALLNRMRRLAEERGERRVDAARMEKVRKRQAARRGFMENKSPAQPGAQRDPRAIGEVVARLSKARGWNTQVAVGSVLGRWAEIIGEENAKHCTPESFEDTVVVMRCDTTARAAQMRLMSHDILKKFDAELGPGIVTVLKVLGPNAPSWRHGMRSVAGRGPRDTYG
ncbi:DciA family protein [Glutamicibacter sp. JC586]|uniref:DciA family protein n=1 Tax=Glutamicibacter sp. JC586 TaxID=2590552 RepID=UPI00135A30CB|nr:DciA family protein [Glutamicibacter sp. JC586]